MSFFLEPLQTSSKLESYMAQQVNYNNTSIVQIEGNYLVFQDCFTEKHQGSPTTNYK